MKKGILKQTVMKKFGKKGFTKSGDIKVSALKELKASKSPTTRKRAVFALNMRKGRNK